MTVIKKKTKEEGRIRVRKQEVSSCTAIDEGHEKRRLGRRALNVVAQYNAGIFHLISISDLQRS